MRGRGIKPSDIMFNVRRFEREGLVYVRGIKWMSIRLPSKKATLLHGLTRKSSTFDPKENVRLKDESTISLASYAARMNIQLLKAADFNQRLREKGCSSKVTVQKVCKIARDEDEVREILEDIWKDPGKAEEVLAEALEKNKEVYDFKKMMEDTTPDENALKTPPLTA